MSKEFEEWDREYVKNSKFSVGPMEERLAAFAAGRALGRREAKGEAADVAWDMLVDGVSWGNDGNCGSPEIVKDAIEAIPEEV